LYFYLYILIVQQGIFPLWLRHHTSVNYIRTDRHLFFTLYPAQSQVL